MLDVEPSKRPSAAQILSHPWMTSPNPLSTQLVVGSKVEDVKVRFFFSNFSGFTVTLLSRQFDTSFSFGTGLQAGLLTRG